jgi:two-component system, cell cycle sensor histidine kinase and response regulator CckA
MEAHNGQSGSTVLVVEDEPNARRLLEIMLSTDNISALLAGDGEEALSLYRDRKREISVILLDLSIPKTSPWDLFQSLKRENPDVCVVVISGYIDPVLQSRMRQAGVKYFIEKPYNRFELLEILQSAMHGVV